ncbi:MAG: FMN-binding protein [Candidatus Omnitrophica bacterium]|nr:FMN-binding protein [Candidatus Omnitrophota bacterium]
MKNKNFYLFFGLGFFSLLSQTLILREFIISFGGNELGIALFYFFWFFWVGVGAYATLRGPLNAASKHFLKLLALYPFLALVEILFFIKLKGFSGINWWEFFTFDKVFPRLFLLTSFVSFFTGAIFSLGVLRLREEKPHLAVSKAYIYEAIGSFFAGVLATVLIGNMVSPLLILILAGIIFSLLSLWVSAGSGQRTAVISNAATLLIFLVLIFNYKEVVNFSHNIRVKGTLPDATFQKEVYTPYQHLLFAELPSQKVIISNGQIIRAIPDVTYADTQAAIFMAEADNPKNILIFGIGAEPIIDSLLQFPVESLTYVIEDKIYQREMGHKISDTRFKVVIGPGRQFLKKNQKRFDLAIVYASDPTSLLINTYFTKEFYALLKESLSDAGVMATRITAAQNFIGEEIANFGSSLYYTLSNVFSKVIIVPGDVNWFFAGGQHAHLTDRAQVLQQRFAKIRPPMFSFPAHGFRTLFNEKRVEFVKGVYINKEKEKLINSDNRPLTFFLNLLVMARYSNSHLVGFFTRALSVGLIIFLLPFIGLLLARCWFLSRVDNTVRRREIFNAKLFQFFSGFLGFSFHLTLIYLFQIKFGVIFQLIGLINGFFMLGLCFGGFLAKRFIEKLNMKMVLFSQAILTVLTYFIFVYLGFANFFIFILFFLTCGILTGSSYPLSAKLLENNAVSLNKVAVNLELLDHWGGAFAGVSAALFMFPILGITKTLTAIAAICVIIFVIISLKFSHVKKCNPALNFFPFVLFALSVALLSSNFLLNKDDSSVVKGHGGPIELTIEVNRAGAITEVEVQKHNETSSYLRELDNFLSQFHGKKPDGKLQLNKDIDAITGATVTSLAILDGVNKTKSKMILDRVSILTIIASIFAIIVYCFGRNLFLRKVYLLLVVIFMWFIFRGVFVSEHLVSVLTLHIPTIFYLVPLGLGLLFGPLWCGWLCPVGAFQELLALAGVTKGVSYQLDKKARFLKYILLTIFIFTVFLGNNALFSQEPAAVTIAKIAALIFSIFFLRFWCRYFCIIGAFFSLFNKVGILRKFFPKRYSNCELNVRAADLDCLQCNRCLSQHKIPPISDNFFKIAFICTAFLIFVAFFFNVKSFSTIFHQQEPSQTLILQNVEPQRIKDLIKSGKLSNRQAAFYEVLKP